MPLPISEIVSVSTVATNVAVDPNNPNNIVFFSVEKPIIPFEYKTYTDVNEIKIDFGDNTNIVKIATKLFSQSPNVKNGNGSFSVLPLLDSVSATSGTSTTIDLTIANFATVTDGYINIVIDSTDTFTLENLDFTGVATLEEFISIMQPKIAGYGTISINGDALVFQSNTYGTSSNISLTQGTGSGTDLSVLEYFDVVNQVETVGSVESGETIEQAIQRMYSYSAFIAFAWLSTDLLMQDSTITSLVEFIATQQDRNAFGMQLGIGSISTAEGVVKDLLIESNYKDVRFFFYGGTQESYQDAVFASLSSRLSSNLDQPNSSLTLHMKGLSGVAGDTSIADEYIYRRIIATGCDCYVNIGGSNVVLQSYAGKMPWDDKYAEVALAMKAQGSIFVLMQNQTKLSFSQNSYDLIYNTLNLASNQMRDAGVITRLVDVSYLDTIDIKVGDREIVLQSLVSNGYYHEITEIDIQERTISLSSVYWLNKNIAKVNITNYPF